MIPNLPGLVANPGKNKKVLPRANSNKMVNSKFLLKCKPLKVFPDFLPLRKELITRTSTGIFTYRIKHCLLR